MKMYRGVSDAGLARLASRDVSEPAYIPDWEEVGQSEWDEVSGDWYFEVVYRP